MMERLEERMTLLMRSLVEQIARESGRSILDATVDASVLFNRFRRGKHSGVSDAVRMCLAELSRVSDEVIGARKPRR